ncbi:sugar phosphate nucleotidyltransferase [Gloeothece verrucosa]|uniref:UTP--glucose-1-phosphate uridylyltransferase n=1 Tax=Gloeothece verrucosa (strain PCC 7822) TaxID=497965 RepID=E0UEU1_GLOV7|nr:sugar phosphate nucleotidyltransferase [Gloeothece verrucosa]ADN13071.1 UTP--glucose-1-phosphate uridylyltransferase [Gloeothece verrucosa PCC 7822]
MSKTVVKKGIIPAAGWGTRLFPATKVLKKEFFPIIDQDGRAKPIILAIVEELLSAGLEEIAIIIQKSAQPLFENFFKTLPQPELYAKLSPENRDYCDYLQEIGKKITFIIQEQQEGYGHAVYCAKDWINNQPFLLSLGDHVYRSETEISCSKQLVELYQKVEKNVVGLTVISAEILHKSGVVSGNWQEKNSVLTIKKTWEKPTREEARSQLHIETLPENQFLALFGLYILSPKIFDYLGQEIQNNCRYRGEFQLTTALDQLCQNDGLIGYVVRGNYFDTGMPEFYRKTLIEFSKF